MVNEWCERALNIQLSTTNLSPSPGLFKHSSTLARAAVLDLAPPPQRASALGLYNMATAVPFVVGPVIGGHIAEWSDDDDAGEGGDGGSRGFSIVAGLCAACFVIDMGVLVTAELCRLCQILNPKQGATTFFSTLDIVLLNCQNGSIKFVCNTPALLEILSKFSVACFCAGSYCMLLCFVW
jgi:MFS family permease